MIPIGFLELQRRLAEIRSWAGEVTEGNRCAMVVGLTLRIKPRGAAQSFRNQPSANPNVRQMPFLEKMFMKANELALEIGRAHGPPEITTTGKAALAAVKGVKGVIYLDNCWKTATEKFLNKSATGDHIDLWDGQLLEIYRTRPEYVQLVQRAQTVLLWRCP